jgi:hypothetical protein
MGINAQLYHIFKKYTSCRRLIERRNFAADNLHTMMKSLLITGSILLTAMAANAQCNELFISEYVEGSGNNKALELYNPTNESVDLGNYRLIRYDNGSIAPSPNAIQLLPPGVFIGSKQTYVIALNLTDPNGTGQAVPIDVALQAKADTLLSNGCGTEQGNIRTMCFNGDDALTLERNNAGTWQIVDIFGCIGERPSNSAGNFSPVAGWTDIPPFSSMPEGYDGSVPYFFRYWTADQTLKRKPTVTSGVSTNPAPQSFNPSVQWDSLPENTFDSLGFHTCVCNIVGISELNDESRTMIYPNPAADFTYIEAAFEIRAVEFRNLLGQLILVENIATKAKKLTVSTSDFPTGLYTVRVMFTNGKTSERKLVVRP